MSFTPHLGLEEVLQTALSQWSPRATRADDTVFGAAGVHGTDVDQDLRHLTQSAMNAYSETEPMNRMFGTDVGKRAAKAVGNEARTLVALERLSIEAMAQSLRLTEQARSEDRLIVVPSRRGRPPILLLMSPRLSRAQDSRIVSEEIDLPLSVLEQGLAETVDRDDKTPEAIAMHELLRGGPRALAELFLVAQPEIVLTRRPQMIPLCVPSPHLRVDQGGEVSTAGIRCRDATGELGVTACYHGTGPVGTDVLVGGRRGRVKAASAVQDVVFIPFRDALELPPVRGLRGLRGVCEDREPARADHAYFDGATNQNRQTRVFGTDAGLLRARPTIMLKVQTDPDTDRGDSGCALVDKEDYVLGFAFERTGYDDYPQFTDWIWAANALRALQLTPG